MKGVCLRLSNNSRVLSLGGDENQDGCCELLRNNVEALGSSANERQESKCQMVGVNSNRREFR